MIYPLMIVLLTIAVFYRTFNFLYIVDDIPMVVGRLRGDGKFPKTLNLKQLFHWVVSRLYGSCTFGTDPKVDHIFTTFLHATICVLIYFALGHDKISFIAALLYCVHPTNHQTSIWGNGKRYAINIILVLLMMLIPKPFNIIAWLLTPFFQVTAFFAPIITGQWYLIPIALLIAGRKWMGQSKARLARVNHPDQLKTFDLKRFIVSVKIFGFYVQRMIFPGTTFMAYPNLYFWYQTKEGDKDAYSINGSFWGGCGSLICFIFACFFLQDSNRLLAIFSTLAIFQWCAIIPAVQHSTDRYISLANVFTTYLVTALLFKYFPDAAPISLALLGGYYLHNLLVAMEMYKNILRFHAYQNYFDPTNVLTRFTLAEGYLSCRPPDPLRAWHEITTGLESNPNDFKMNLQAARICLVMGDCEMARKFLEVAKTNTYIGQADSWKDTFDEMETIMKKPMVYANAQSSSVFTPNREQRRHSKEFQRR